MSTDHAIACLGSAAALIADRVLVGDWVLQSYSVELQGSYLVVRLTRLKHPGEPRRGQLIANASWSLLALGDVIHPTFEELMDELYKAMK